MINLNLFLEREREQKKNRFLEVIQVPESCSDLKSQSHVCFTAVNQKISDIRRWSLHKEIPTDSSDDLIYKGNVILMELKLFILITINEPQNKIMPLIKDKWDENFTTN